MKYLLKRNKQEIKAGEVINLVVPVETPYGPAEATVKVKVTEPILVKLISDGFVVAVADKKPENVMAPSDRFNLGSLIETIAKMEEGPVFVELADDEEAYTFLKSFIEGIESFIKRNTEDGE